MRYLSPDNYAAIRLINDGRRDFDIGTISAALATTESAIASTLVPNGKEYLKIRFTTVENCLGNEPVL
jgi:hypothetical protein